MTRIPFIPPASPRLRPSPPTGENWIFEVKFDGWRVQLHKADNTARIFGKNGGDLNRRFPTIVAAALDLPTGSYIVDGELIAAGARGEPNFLALMRRRHVPVCVYAFDLLDLRGRDLRDQPLVQRRAQLDALLDQSRSDLIRYSDSFTDANALLAECARRGLEGIVCKRKHSVYRSGARSGWIKVKTAEWKADNRWRGEFFEK